MPLRSDWSTEHCPIRRSLDVLGDPWILLIVRDVLHGNGRFEQAARQPRHLRGRAVPPAAGDARGGAAGHRRLHPRRPHPAAVRRHRGRRRPAPPAPPGSRSGASGTRPSPTAGRTWHSCTRCAARRPTRPSGARRAGRCCGPRT
ncbi:hypothetical protein [Nocardioides convexus]|uniref:winged helix-turn-helix transcriptional regulator n=1 Tax=Nocardioides convexus TaxID=2712224 RepID=UPI0024187C2E|nr:hypothetical protein [Nocardioides convexus]